MSSPFSTAKVTPPGIIIVGLSGVPAKAIIIAGKPLSHVAIPKTPLVVGIDLLNLLITIAASFLYGRLSIMPEVP